MSIATELTRIQQAKEDIKEALISKGCPVLSSETIDDYVKYINMMGEYHDYSQDYLTFIAKETGTFTLTIGSAVTTSVLTSISYSTDDGETWTTTNNANDATVTITTPTVNKGNKVLWKGTGVGVSTTTNNSNRPSTSSIFSSTGTFDVEGNILSLVWGDNFVGKDYVAEGSSYNFALLFYEQNMPEYAKVVSAKNMCMPIKNVPTCCYFRMFQASTGATANSVLVEAPSKIGVESVGASACTSMFYACTLLTAVPSLPATTLAEGCYGFMFQRCESLTSIPNGLLPATTLARMCYRSMFSMCTGLTSIPSDLLPATTLTDWCYPWMFEFCSSLTNVPSDLLPATTLTERCYYGMFSECASLATVPSDLLPATTLAHSCYAGMFYHCTSLTTAPELPATTLGVNCYESMFDGCTSLTTAPELPATTLAMDCYQHMFNGCTSLTVAPPTLPALTVPSGSSSSYGCYQRMFSGCTSLTSSPIISATTIGEKGMSEMFRGCTNLSNITCLATDISATNCTENWVTNVAASGTFTKAASMSSWTTGANGIPANWTVVDAT